MVLGQPEFSKWEEWKLCQCNIKCIYLLRQDGWCDMHKNTVPWKGVSHDQPCFWVMWLWQTAISSCSPGVSHSTFLFLCYFLPYYKLQNLPLSLHTQLYHHALNSLSVFVHQIAVHCADFLIFPQYLILNILLGLPQYSGYSICYPLLSQPPRKVILPPISVG